MPVAAAVMSSEAPPHDFTQGPLKVGDAPEDLYRAFMTGLNGSPMPSYG